MAAPILRVPLWKRTPPPSWPTVVLWMAATAVVVGVFAMSSCAHAPGQPITFGTVVACGGQAVQSCAEKEVPAVNTCLAALKGADSSQCLDDLVLAGGCATVDVVACLVRGAVTQQASFTDSPEAQRMVSNGNAWLKAHGIQFATVPEPQP